MNANFVIDHIALDVRDAHVSAKFYGEVLGLKEIENKTRRPEIRWLAFDGHRSIHLITGGNPPPPDRPINAHFALSTTNFDATLEELKAKGVVYRNLYGEKFTFNLRGDGVKQCYLQDPDNYWVEVCEANPDGTVG